MEPVAGRGQPQVPHAGPRCGRVRGASIAIGVISTAFTDPGTASGFLSTYGILGLVIMYLAANVALIVDWARLRRRGVHKNPWLWVVVPVIGVAVLAIPVWGDLRPGQASRSTPCPG